MRRLIDVVAVELYDELTAKTVINSQLPTSAYAEIIVVGRYLNHIAVCV